MGIVYIRSLKYGGNTTVLIMAPFRERRSGQSLVGLLRLRVGATDMVIMFALNMTMVSKAATVIFKNSL